MRARKVPTKQTSKYSADAFAQAETLGFTTNYITVTVNNS